MTSKPNPYIGPRPFRTGEKLHGRARELRELLDLLVAERILLLHSPSGAGKSSLIYAGLIPRLKEEGFYVFPVARVNAEEIRVPSPNGSGEVPRTPPNRYITSLKLSLEESLPAEQRLPLEDLVRIDLGEYLSRCCLPEQSEASSVLIIDQFEEILTQSPADVQGKQEFFSQLGAALRDRTRWVLFAMREDYLPGLNPYLRPIPTRLSNTYRLDFLGVEAAYQAIQNPALESGTAYEEEAAWKLIEDLRSIQIQLPDGSVEKQAGPYVEPVQLQVVCYRLWERHDSDDDCITVSDIAELGDVDESLAEYYSERVAFTAANTGLSERVIREWVEQHLITDQGLRGSVQMGVESTKGLSNQAIRLLENGHLVRAEKRAGATWFELTHDRLIPPVRRDNAAWLQSNLSLLQRQSRLWELEHRPESLLLRGADLEEAQQWSLTCPLEISLVEEQFLEASHSLAERERTSRELAEQKINLEAAQKVAEAEKKRAEDVARANERLRRRAFLLTAALLAFLAASVMMFWFANTSQANFAAAQTQEALAVQARNEAEQNAVLAGLARVEAEQNAQLAEEKAQEARRERENALQSLADSRTQQAIAEAASTQAISQQSTASAANQQVLVVAQQAMEQDSSEDTRQEVAGTVSRSMASIALNLVESDPETALLLSVEAFKTSDTSESRYALLTILARTLEGGLGQQVWTIQERTTTQAFSPGGLSVAAGTASGRVLVFDTVTGDSLTTRQTSAQSPVTALAFSPDGAWLAVGSQSGLIEMMSMGRRSPFHYEPEQPVTSLEFSPDSKVLASGGAGDAVYLWDNGQQIVPPFLDTPSGRMVSSLSWKPDVDGEGRRVLAAGMLDGSIWIWDVNSRSGTPLVEGGQTGRIERIAWSNDGEFLAAAAAGSDPSLNLRVWEAASGEPRPVPGSTSSITAVAFGVTNSWLAYSTQAGEVTIWNPSANHPIGPPLVVPGGTARQLAFSQEPGFLYAISDKGGVVHWDLRPESWVELACSSAGRNLNRQEWSTYFPNQGQRKTCPNIP